MDPDDDWLGFSNLGQEADLFALPEISPHALFPQADNGLSFGDEAWQQDAILATAPTPAIEPLGEPMPPSVQAPLKTTPSRRKARTLRDRDWDPMKDRIIHLWRVEGKPLKDVKRILKQEFRFEATFVL